MGKKSKPGKYAVDTTYLYGPQKHPFKYFTKLHKAVRYARENGIPAGEILDENGNTIPGMDLWAPIYLTHRQLRGRLEEAQNHVESARAFADARNLEDNRRLLRAGLIPLRELRHLIDRNVTANNMGGHHTEYNLTLRVRNNDELGSDIIRTIITGEQP